MTFTFPSPVDFVANLKAALRAACLDFTRSHMSCVRLELSAGRARFVATNGHWLWINECFVTGSDVASLVIGLDDVKRLIKAVNTSKKATTWAVELDVDGCAVRQLSTVVSFARLDDAFPPYAQILPHVAPPAEPKKGKSSKAPIMSYDATYLSDVSASFADIVGKTKNGIGVTFEPGASELDPVVITCPKAADALAILMPRKEDARAGAALCDRYRTSVAETKAA